MIWNKMLLKGAHQDEMVSHPCRHITFIMVKEDIKVLH